METVCFFNKMDPFPLSNGRLVSTGFVGINHCHDSERPLRKNSTLKRKSETNMNELSGALSPIKQLRMDNSHDYLRNSDSSTLEVKLNLLSATGENCDIRAEKNLSPIGQLRKLDLKELCLKQILQTSVLHKTNIDLNMMLEQSRQKLYNSIDDTFENSESNRLLYDIDADDTDIPQKRCRSLPNSLSSPTKTIPCHLPEKNLTVQEISKLRFPLTTTKTSIHNLHSDDYLKVDDVCDDDVNNSEDEGDDLKSRSSTPSSGFIDIEADTPHSSPPSSPLNLSTHNESIAIHDTLSKTAMMVHSHTCAQNSQCASKAASQEDRNIDICEENVKQNFQSTEKKINFSIDAILRPDFGSSNCGTNDSNILRPDFGSSNCGTNDSNFLRPDFGSSNCGTNDSKNVSHSQRAQETSSPVSPSAFTAVDLSIKSRSESLSSPCSSSSSRSSPSSPLSSSSPLALRRNWDNGHELSTEPYTRNPDNFLYPQRRFPSSNKDVEMFIGGQFPFVNPAIHGVSKGPLTRPFPPPTHVINSPFVGDLTHSRNYCFVPKDINPKGERLLQKDISKLVNWSVQNHLTNSSKPQIISHKQSLISREPMNNSVLKRIPSNQNTQLSEDAKLRPKCDSVKTNAADRPSQNTLPFQTCSNIPTKEKKRDLKQDKQRVSDKNTAQDKGENPLWPAWVFCTRYSDRPSSGPRSRKQKRNKAQDEKRPRTAFTNDQLQRLKREFEDCRYLTETRRKNLADQLGLTESQIKIWFQNKRAKIKKSVGVRNPLALQLMEQGLYNHSTVKDFLNQELATETSDAGEDSS